MAAPTTTPGTGFGAPRRRSPPRRSGPKLQTPRGAAPPTAMRGRGSENGKEKEKESEKEKERGNERKETRPSERRKRIKTGEFEIDSNEPFYALLFQDFIKMKQVK